MAPKLKWRNMGEILIGGATVFFGKCISFFNFKRLYKMLHQSNFTIATTNYPKKQTIKRERRKLNKETSKKRENPTWIRVLWFVATERDLHQSTNNIYLIFNSHHVGLPHFISHSFSKKILLVYIFTHLSQTHYWKLNQGFFHHTIWDSSYQYLISSYTN